MRMSAKPVLRTLILSAFFGLATPAWAISDSEIVSAIEKAKILAPTIRMNARVGKDEVEVSTYKNPKAEDKDCKIEAVLIAKTVMELAPGDVPRVIVYFYSSNSLSRFKQVAVTAGDVKAFGSGPMSQDELLRSISIREDFINDPGKRVASYLSEGQYQRPKRVSTVLKGDKIELTTALDSSLSEKLLKLEALKLGEQALEAAPSEFKTVDVNFQDASAAKEHKVISFDRNKLATLNEAINSALKEVVIGAKPAEIAGKIDYQNYQVKEGLRMDERKDLFARMKALDKAGVGVGKIVTDSFLEIESDSATATDAELNEKIEKLSKLLSRFEQNLKNAKEFKAVGGTKGGDTAPAGKTPAAAAGGSEGLPGSGANDSELKARILLNPEGHLAAMAAGLARKTASHNGEDHPNYPKILQFVIDTLKANGRGAEAAKYEQKLEAIKAKAAAGK